MLKKSLTFKLILMWILLLLMACTTIPCLEDSSSIHQLHIENNGYIWNCGLSNWSADSTDIDKICDILQDSEIVNPISVRLSNWRLDIYFNNEKEELFRSNLMFFNTKKNGYVFRKNDKYFRNDELAIYFIEKLRITNSNSDPCE